LRRARAGEDKVIARRLEILTRRHLLSFVFITSRTLPLTVVLRQIFLNVLNAVDSDAQWL
jgi:hypothetical protein